ncbi:thiamine-phosphate kinase [Microbulbifer halophilus]|uniref:Thiamine-monophosphate kinase n=1 Tax=Microbulbifer halophilus TaxID=453963 RepID=A0ABW5EK34_9GAMM|nr:thiamine-phosphate kinase [Microbulbifer halophilus]MCW8127651.1 thiamine-phosphate kinase [Microbulbifer halophilus]
MPGPGEFQIIRDYFSGAPQGEGVALGIGDDCALLQPPPGLLATSVDTLVADRHFPADANPGLIASRALRVNLSDLAAMNARPLWFTLALTLPDSNPDWLRRFADGLLQTAEAFGISLVGGDTTRGPLSITVEVIGSTHKPLRRDGAGVGHGIHVSGPLGAAAAALPVVLNEREVTESERRAAEEAYYRPQPQLSMAAALGDIASAAVDISDGLLADLGHICKASGLTAEVQMEKLPVAALAQTLAGERALQLAATGGDDYQLCFTLPPEHAEAAEKLGAVCIGTLTEGQGEVRPRLKGEPWVHPSAGFQHF